MLTDCSVDSGILSDSSVSTLGLQDCAVTYAKIQNLTGARLVGRYDAAAGTIQEITLAGGLTFDSNTGTISSDTTIGLVDSQVDSGILADLAVSTLGLQDSAVTTVKIDDAGVTYAKIQDVTAQRLLGREDALAGSPQEIALSAELRFDTTNDWLEVSDSGILNGLIADSAITTVKISDSQVTYAKIQNVTAQRLLGRWDALAGTTQEVPLSAELRFDSTNDWLEISDSGVSTGLIADSAVTMVKINDAAITASKFYDTTLTTRVITLHPSDTTLAVGDTLATFFVPAELNGYDLVRAEAAVKVVSTSGRPTIQIRDVTGAADMLVNKITIDSGEKTSYTSDTASSIDTTNDTLATGQEIAIDVDSAGTGAEDLYVILSVRKP